MNDIKNHPDVFRKYYEFLIQENQKINLTAITNIDEVYYKHFVDSLMLKNICDFTQKESLCDVGSGAGFPSIPLKIVFPHLKVTIIEPIFKRCLFLQKLIKHLNLTNVDIIHARAENLVVKREQYDVVCARAVAFLPILLELCIPLVKPHGYFLAMKGSQYQDEVVAASNALNCLDATIEKIYDYSLSNYGNHCIIIVKKNKETLLKYPRNFAIIKKKPL